jgi:predicted MFS family arabinose efflux permease
MRRLLERNRSLFIYLIVSSFLLNFGHRVWQAMFNNFAIERIGVGPEAIGWIQSVRELPGLMAFLLAFLALVLSELRIMALSLVVLGIGLVFTGQATTIPILLIATIVMSFGFHFFEPCSSGVVLMSIDREESPKVLGQLRSLGAIAALTATGVVYLLVDRLGYRALFLIVGIAVAVGGAVLFTRGKGEHGLPPKRRVKLRKRYWLFYTLAFLMGSRRHIFTTFAPFLLVLTYGVNVRTMSLLFLVNALVNTYVYQKVGKLVPKLGERTILSIAFALLIPVFLGYAYVSVLPILFALFIVDNMLFGFNLGLTTYLQKIAMSPEELTSNLSAQTTINHVSAVIIPVVGGTVWALLGSQATFFIGVGIALVSLVLAQWIRIPAAQSQG